MSLSNTCLPRLSIHRNKWLLRNVDTVRSLIDRANQTDERHSSENRRVPSIVSKCPEEWALFDLKG
jgi:hypothetical protein